MYCKYCGKEIANPNKCEHCGALQNESSSSPSSATQSYSLNGKIDETFYKNFKKTNGSYILWKIVEWFGIILVVAFDLLALHILKPWNSIPNIFTSLFAIIPLLFAGTFEIGVILIGIAKDNCLYKELLAKKVNLHEVISFYTATLLGKNVLSAQIALQRVLQIRIDKSLMVLYVLEYIRGIFTNIPCHILSFLWFNRILYWLFMNPAEGVLAAIKKSFYSLEFIMALCMFVGYVIIGIILFVIKSQREKIFLENWKNGRYNAKIAQLMGVDYVAQDAKTVEETETTEVATQEIGVSDANLDSTSVLKKDEAFAEEPNYFNDVCKKSSGFSALYGIRAILGILLFIFAIGNLGYYLFSKDNTPGISIQIFFAAAMCNNTMAALTTILMGNRIRKDNPDGEYLLKDLEKRSGTYVMKDTNSWGPILYAYDSAGRVYYFIHYILTMAVLYIESWGLVHLGDLCLTLIKVVLHGENAGENLSILLQEPTTPYVTLAMLGYIIFGNIFVALQKNRQKKFLQEYGKTPEK